MTEKCIIISGNAVVASYVKTVSVRDAHSHTEDQTWGEVIGSWPKTEIPMVQNKRAALWYASRLWSLFYHLFFSQCSCYLAGQFTSYALATKMIKIVARQ